MKRFKTRFSMMGKLQLAVLALALCLTSGTASAFDFDVEGTKVTLGGYLKVMLNYDFNGALNNNTNHPTDGDIINAYDAPLDGTTYEDENDFGMTTRESRVFLKTATDSDVGLITTHFEGDFNGDVGGSPSWSNSRTFRLRHAYGVIHMGQNTILAGQTWSTMMDFAAAVPVMDLSSDPGVVFVRQPQVRFQHNFDKGHFFALAMENPARGLTANGNGPLLINSETKSADTMPDLIAKYFWGTKNFHLSPAVLVRRFELDGKSSMAWGSSLTGHIGFGKGHTFYGGVLYGDGMGRYGGLGLNTGAGLTASGDIETVSYMGYNSGFTFKLKDNLAWTLGCGYSENDEDAYTGSDAVLTGSASKEAFSYHTNLVWNINKSLEYAVGFISMKQKVMDDREGDLMRVQNYVKFSF
ncbi:MAG: hypothetical protein KKD44_18895 [Proteobacteria bacterium]|nr:hypothetical protein [Pseudomonadota bacterium]